MRREAKEHLEPPGAGRGRRAPPLGLWWGAGPCDTFVQTPTPRWATESLYVAWSHPVCGGHRRQIRGLSNPPLRDHRSK